MKADFETDCQRYAMSESERTELKECTKDHRQLAEWLKELKERREQDVPDKNVGDAVSRQAAIDCFWSKERYFRDALDVIKDIRRLPSARPDRKHGKWIYHIDDIFPAESTMECDQCHAEQPLTCDDEFCPHCGARMEGDK